MPYDKLKSENYANVRGINQKASVYVTGEQEVLDLMNYDFQNPGSWTKRWGYTNGVAGTAAAFSGSIFGFNSWIGYNGQSTSRVSAQNFIFSRFGCYTYDPTLGNASLAVTGATFWNGLTPSTPDQVDWSSFGDFMFVSKFELTSMSNSIVWKYGTSFDFTGTTFFGKFGYFGQPDIGLTAGSVSFSISGLPGNLPAAEYKYYFGYIDDYSYPSTLTYPNKPQYFLGPINLNYYKSVSVGANSTILIHGFGGVSLPGSPYNPRSIAIYRDNLQGGLYPPDYIGLVGYLTTGTFTDTGGTPTSVFYPGVGDSYGYEAKDISEFANVGVAPLGSHYLETWNDRLWIAQKATGRLYYSETSDPQTVLAESYEPFQTDNAIFTGLKATNQQLLVFYEKSVYRITGYDDFDVQQLTNEYGAISDKTIVAFEERVWFLDQNQVIEFNGSQFTNVGYRVKNYLDSMNVQAAKTIAWSYFFSDRNEVWFGVPVLGASQVNYVLVYDYVVDSWTAFRFGANMSAIGELNFSGQAGVTTFTDVGPTKTFMGSTGGTMFYFDKSFKTDNSAGITCIFETRNHTEIGKSSTAVYRRLYIDANGYSATLTFNTSFYADFATASISATQAMTFASSQGRIDFGIPAAALRMRVFCTSSGSNDLQTFGYTLESRFQRRTTKP